MCGLYFTNRKLAYIVLKTMEDLIVKNDEVRQLRLYMRAKADTQTDKDACIRARRLEVRADLDALLELYSMGLIDPQKELRTRTEG